MISLPHVTPDWQQFWLLPLLLHLLLISKIAQLNWNYILFILKYIKIKTILVSGLYYSLSVCDDKHILFTLSWSDICSDERLCVKLLIKFQCTEQLVQTQSPPFCWLASNLVQESLLSTIFFSHIMYVLNYFLNI